MSIPTFRDREKEKYRDPEFKQALFSKDAQARGTYKGHAYDFCLADTHSAENLHQSFRDEAIAYFASRHIRWHDGHGSKMLPSSHLCCSQSCCVNFLFPMQSNDRLLAAVFKAIYPEMRMPLPMAAGDINAEGGLPYLSFEWIGLTDYLGETRRKPGRRTRGANYTSADFAFRFQRTDGQIQIVLGEWKYTEYYGHEDKGTNQTRLDNYAEAFRRLPGVFICKDQELYRGLFFEPFYQLMRLQLLAQEMEANHEMGADIVTVLHVHPAANKEFTERVTSEYLSVRYPGQDVMGIWKQLVDQIKFRTISVENLLQLIGKARLLADLAWVDYLQTRYTLAPHIQPKKAGAV
jgi:hypothetical protein